jgi:hypothetical protein
MPSIPEFIPTLQGPDLEEQNRQLDIERAVLAQKAECLLEKLETLNEHRNAEMKLYESFLKTMKEIWTHGN